MRYARRPVAFKGVGQIDPRAWAAANGIAPDRVIDLPAVRNMLMPPIFREFDVTLFPNCAEDGINLVAMECMACCVPLILSANTGHLDLIGPENCYPLTDHRTRPGHFANLGGVPGWGESQMDDVVERLEQVLQERDKAARRGSRGAQTMERLTWGETAQQMKAIALSPSNAT